MTVGKRKIVLTGGPGAGKTAVSAAREIDERILKVWEGHPQRIVIESSAQFLDKARRTLEAIRAEVPRCCNRVAPAAQGISRRQSVVTQVAP